MLDRPITIQSLPAEHHQFIRDLQSGQVPQDLQKSLSQYLAVFRHESRIYSPLSWAAAHNNIDVVKAILSLRCSELYKCNQTCNTALHESIRSGHLGLVDMLISSELFQIDCVDEEGYAGIHYAARSGSVQIIELLLDAGADLNLFSSHGLLPLHYAAEFGHLRALQYLLDQKSANIPDRTGRHWNILHRAARYGHIHLCRFLTIRSIVDIDETDSSGYTALDLARKYEQHSVVALFESMRKLNESRPEYLSDRSSIDTDQEGDVIGEQTMIRKRIPILSGTISKSDSIQEWKSSQRTSDMIQLMSKELANIRTLHLRQVTRLEAVIADKDRTTNEMQHNLRVLQNKIDRQKEEIDLLRGEIRQYQSGNKQHLRPIIEGNNRSSGSGRYTRIQESHTGKHSIKIESVKHFPNVTDRN